MTRGVKGTSSKVAKPCKHCGKDFLVQPSALNRRTYCSHDCMAKDYSHTPEERIAAFWRMVLKTDTCWLWTGAARWDGYGRFNPSRNLKQMTAHRYSWEIHNGEIPEGIHVLHTCNMPACVNPAHLKLGTHRDNMRDMSKAGHRHIPGVRLSNR